MLWRRKVVWPCETRVSQNHAVEEIYSEVSKSASLLFSDVRYDILAITIIALFFYHNTITNF